MELTSVLTSVWIVPQRILLTFYSPCLHVELREQARFSSWSKCGEHGITDLKLTRCACGAFDTTWHPPCESKSYRLFGVGGSGRCPFITNFNRLIVWGLSHITERPPCSQLHREHRQVQASSIQICPRQAISISRYNPLLPPLFIQFFSKFHRVFVTPSGPVDCLQHTDVSFSAF